MPWAKTLQSCISFLQSANTYFTTTKWIYDWNDLRLASIMSFFTATSHTCYCILPSPKFHQLEEVKIQVLHSDFTVLWTGKLFCWTWKPWWNCTADFFFHCKLFLIKPVLKPIGLEGFLFKSTMHFTKNGKLYTKVMVHDASSGFQIFLAKVKYYYRQIWQILMGTFSKHTYMQSIQLFKAVLIKTKQQYNMLNVVWIFLPCPHYKPHEFS